MSFLRMLFLIFLVKIFLPPNIYAQSIVQMQKDYDEVKYKISSTIIDLPCLDADIESSQRLKQMIYDYLKELQNNLVISKNYKQAEIKYNNLLRTFYEEPEVIAIIKNYNDFNSSETLRIDLVKNKIISIAEFENWKKNVLEKYKLLNGANYNIRTGSYNSITDIILSI